MPHAARPDNGGAVVPRWVGTLEVDFEDAGALSTSGGALLDPGDARTFAVGWVC